MISASAEYAKNRLKSLLTSDRLGASPEIISRLKEDIVFSTSKYLEFEEDQMKLNVVYKNHKGKNKEFKEEDNINSVIYIRIPVIDYLVK